MHLRRGALLHDIGKMGIPDRILLKPGPLNDDEWVIMRRHPVYAYELLSPIEYPAAGAGHPLLPPREVGRHRLPARAEARGRSRWRPASSAVVDVWDALSSDRPYRPAWPAAKVRAYVRDAEPAATSTRAWWTSSWRRSTSWLDPLGHLLYWSRKRAFPGPAPAVTHTFQDLWRLIPF